MNNEEKEIFVSECKNRWNYNSKYLPYYISEAMNYQKLNNKNFLLFEQYCINNDLEPNNPNSKLEYSKNVLGMATTFLPTYCSFESLCTFKNLEMYEVTKTKSKIKKLFKRK